MVFKIAEDADAAKKALDKTVYRGREIKVANARPTVPFLKLWKKIKCSDDKLMFFKKKVLSLLSCFYAM